MFVLIGYSMLCIFLEFIKGGEIRGVFYLIKIFGLNFWRLMEKMIILYGVRYIKKFLGILVERKVF